MEDVAEKLLPLLKSSIYSVVLEVVSLYALSY